MKAVHFGLLLARSRLSARFSLVAAGVTLGFVAMAALFERDNSTFGALDNVLLGAVFGLAIPLFCYVVVSQVVSASRLDDASAPFARHGADRRQVVLGVVAVMTAFGAAGATAMGLTALAIAAGSPSQAWSELWPILWIGALGGVVYVAWFSLGSLFGRRGGGRFLLLAVDWLVGSSSTLAALPLPRGHLRNLLGGQPVIGLEQSTASVILAALTLSYIALALRRVPR